MFLVMSYRVGQYVFRTKSEYEGALRDQEKIDSLVKEGRSVAAQAKNYKRQIREQKITFETKLGREFLADLNRQTFTGEDHVTEEILAGRELSSKKSPSPKGKVPVEKREKRGFLQQFRLASLLLFGGLLLGCGIYIGQGMLRDYLSYRKALHLQEVIRQAQIEAEEQAQLEAYQKSQKNKEQQEEHDKLESIGVDFSQREMLPGLKQLHDQNPDLVGWLTIPDTKVDYPVMYKAEDNDYYLSHNFDKEKDRNGLLVLDKRCDERAAGNHLLIHGHNMKSGFMFGNLSLYYDKAYYEKHPRIVFKTLYEEKEYDIIAVFLASVSTSSKEEFHYYDYIRMDDWKSFDSYIKEAKSKALYDIPIEASYGDELITLSTCDYSLDEGRLVIVGRRVYGEKD